MKLFAVAWIAICMAGCASAPQVDAPTTANADVALSYKDKVLGWFGVKPPEIPDTPEKPDVQLPDRRIKWRLSASDSLNANMQGQPVALLTRIYKLKSPDAFLKAPYEAFGDSAKEKELLADDLIESRDLQLIPGQHYEATDKVAREASYIGIVALYRAPASTHWRYAFSANKAEWSGLNIGLHACAMSVQTGEPVGESARTVKSAALPCPKTSPSSIPLSQETTK